MVVTVAYWLSKLKHRLCETNGAKQERCEENLIIVIITYWNQKTRKHFDHWHQQHQITSLICGPKISISQTLRKADTMHLQILCIFTYSWDGMISSPTPLRNNSHLMVFNWCLSNMKMIHAQHFCDMRNAIDKLIFANCVMCKDL